MRADPFAAASPHVDLSFVHHSIRGSPHHRPPQGKPPQRALRGEARAGLGLGLGFGVGVRVGVGVGV